MRNPTILITGGLGFIGSYCVEKWKNLGWNVVVIDNQSANCISSDSEIVKDCVVISKSVLDVDFDSLPKFDLILHLASPIGPARILKQSGDMARFILDDIYWAISGAKKNNCPMIFASTSEIYGYRAEKCHLKETDDKITHGEFTVRNEYAIAKLLSEIVLSNTGKIDPDFRYQIVRPFNVSGARQLPDGGFVLPRFVEQATTEKDITVYNTGEQTRAFTWVQDIVEGIYLVSQTKQYWNQEWNVGNAKNEIAVGMLAQKVKQFSKSNSNIINVDPKTLHGPLFAEAPERIPNSEKIQKLLGWKPTKNVDEIVSEVVTYYSK